jgi:hypothetical protein
VGASCTYSGLQRILLPYNSTSMQCGTSRSHRFQTMELLNNIRSNQLVHAQTPSRTSGTCAMESKMLHLHKMQGARCTAVCGMPQSSW